MSTALLYRPGQRWQIWVSFVGAILVHIAAVAIAANQLREIPQPVLDDSKGWDEVPILPEEPVTPIPAETSVPPPPPLTTDEPEFPTDTPTPPPVRQSRKAQEQPFVRTHVSGPARPAIWRGAGVVALNAPRPEYPYEARRARVTGSGVALLRIDPSTGYVIEVSMSRSTGSAVLDNATISGFRRWRFKPGTITVQTPITYTLTGASY